VEYAESHVRDLLQRLPFDLLRQSGVVDTALGLATTAGLATPPDWCDPGLADRDIADMDVDELITLALER